MNLFKLFIYLWASEICCSVQDRVGKGENESTRTQVECTILAFSWRDRGKILIKIRSD